MINGIFIPGITERMFRDCPLEAVERLMAEGEVIEIEYNPAAQWIPVAVRLPKVGEDVMFSVADMYVAEGCLRADGNWWQFRWDTVRSKEHVKAWKPLPEPYKEGKE